MNKTSIELRNLLQQDVEFLHTWLNDKEVMHYIPGVFKTRNLEEIFEYYKERVSDTFRFIICTAKDSIPIGSCRLFNIDTINRKCELSIYIGNKDFWGKGLGNDTILQCQLIAFELLKLNRLELYCFKENVRAINCYLQCGFKVEGELRDYSLLEGRFADVLIMAILYNDYFNLIS